MRIAVIGSRTIGDYQYLKLLLAGIDITEVISGGAAGVDTLAEQWAQENGVPLTVFRPNYARHGKQAPLLRNLQIIDAAEAVYVLWDGKSQGTRTAMDYARRKGKPVVCRQIANSQQGRLF